MMRRLHICFQVMLILIAFVSLHAQPVLLKEVPEGSTNFTRIGGLVYFTSGDSLFRTDGTAGGTIFLKKVPARFFKEFNGNLYALAAGSGGTEVWRSDGTPAGTIMLQTYSSVTFMEPTGNYIYFVASTNATGREIYRTDGTPGGTILLKDINPGPANGMPELPYFQNRSWHYYPSGFAGNLLFFGADNGTQGIELWKTDGSVTGTVMVEDINPGAGNGFVSVAPASFNNEFYFAGFTSQDGVDPWVSNGTEDGTRLLKNLTLASTTDYIEYTVDYKGFLYFAAKLSPDLHTPPALELWRTDGTEPGTSFIKKFCDECDVHRNVLVYNDKLYFFLQRQEFVFLWKTDGTTTGTEEIYSQLLDGSIPFFDVVNDLILFHRNSQGNSTVFARSDGTSAGTTGFWLFNSGVGRQFIDMAKINDLVFFNDHDGPGDSGGQAVNPEDFLQLMRTDGYTVESLRSITGRSFAGTGNIVNYNGKLLFTTQDNQFGSADTRKRLWIYDPTQPPQDTATFTLVNADTDKDIQTLKDGDTITKPAGTHFNIRYNPVGSPGSVVFKHQGKVVRIENSAPFALRGDYSGNYIPWEAGTAGSHKVEATPYSQAGGKGTAGTTLTINFRIVDETSEGCLASGTILREFWAGVPGARIEHIPLDEEPTSTNELTIFEGPVNIGTNYATRIRGYICPPATGDYIFWIASNDHSELWLSTDDNPSSKLRIANVSGATNPRQWNKFASQRSVPVALVQGNRYYIEALHKQGVGTDHIAIGWQLPDGTQERPIPGNRLSPFQDGASRTASTAEARYSQIGIYPNPAPSGTPELRIAGYEGIEETIETNVEIINMTGEVVFAERVSCGGDCKSYLMNIKKQLVAGIYMVNMYTNGTRTAKRLLVK